MKVPANEAIISGQNRERLKRLNGVTLTTLAPGVAVLDDTLLFGLLDESTHS
jgi:hypothetical protein